MARESSVSSPDEKQYLKSLLECSICLETFDEPRTLSCLHSFCEKCLENFVDGKREDELNCPVCRAKFTLNKEGVSGMTRDNFICNMVEVLSIQRQDKCIPCSHCNQASVGRCVTCESFMCESCLQSHNGYIGFRDHAVLTMAELSQPKNRSKIKGKSYCKKHSSKKLKLYCETCEELVCTYCAVFEHVRPDHVCSPLEEVAERKREELKVICTALKSKKNSTEKYYDELTVSSLHLDKNFEEEKSNIFQEKNIVLQLVKDALEKKAQTLIEETEEIARVKKQRIDKEANRVSVRKAGQKKAHDMAKALVDNGSSEEIMSSYKLVQKSVEYERGYGICKIDNVVLKHSDCILNDMFLDEINLKAISSMEVVNRWSSFESDTMSAEDIQYIVRMMSEDADNSENTPASKVDKLAENSEKNNSSSLAMPMAVEYSSKECPNLETATSEDKNQDLAGIPVNIEADMPRAKLDGNEPIEQAIDYNANKDPKSSTNYLKVSVQTQPKEDDAESNDTQTMDGELRKEGINKRKSRSIFDPPQSDGELKSTSKDEMNVADTTTKAGPKTFTAKETEKGIEAAKDETKVESNEEMKTKVAPTIVIEGQGENKVRKNTFSRFKKKKNKESIENGSKKGREKKREKNREEIKSPSLLPFIFGRR